jgi:ribosome-associated toxin RatA of RatAB toxin-antitoxin module
MLKRFLLCLLLFCTLPAMAQENALEVSVKRVNTGDHNVFEVSSSGAVKAPPEVVWKILTDYERMPEFVPDLQRSKLLSRIGNTAVIEQYGEARFLFFKRSIHLIVSVLEQPISVIEIGLVSGDMKVYTCRWELVPIPETGGTRIHYTGKLVPKFYVPGMLGSNIIRSDIEKMMAAVLERLDRPG